MSVEILGPAGTPVPRQDGLFLLEEARSYRLLAPAIVGATLSGRDLLRGADGVFAIGTEHAVGEYELLVNTEAGAIVCQLRVDPRQTKISPALWGELLEDLERWLPGVTVGAEGARKGAVGSQGVSAPLLVEALLPLLPALEGALRSILAEPREHDRERLRDRRLRECRKVDSGTLSWLSRHPEVAVWLDGWRSAEAVGAPPTLPRHVVLSTLDHPANRYIAWLCRRVSGHLENVSAALNELAKRREDGGWCTSRAERAAAGALRLRALVRRSWLGAIRPAPPTEAAFLVVANDPRYGRFHRLARRFIAPMFRLQSDAADPGAAVRPSYSIYEIWCFLALERALRDALPTWTWTFERLAELLDITGTGEKARAIARCGASTLTLELNPTFPSLYAHRSAPRYSLSGKRRPDFVLTFDTPEARRWVVLDAKYRAGRQNLHSAMESLHIYRDSLIDDQRGGRTRAAVLLVPRPCEEVPAWSDRKWQETWGLGVVALAPSTDSQTIARWALRALGIEPPEEVR